VLLLFQRGCVTNTSQEWWNLTSAL